MYNHWLRTYDEQDRKLYAKRNRKAQTEVVRMKNRLMREKVRGSGEDVWEVQ